MNKKYLYLILFFLIVASLVAFGRIMSNNFINFDDPGYITKNYIVQSGLNPQSIQWAFSTTYLSNWHPLTWLSHMLDWTLFGNNAGGHHIVSLLLHIGTIIFLFLFLNKTTKNIWAAAFAAAFFVLHPLRVESVAWASERKDVLSMFFGIACLYAYAFYVERQKRFRYFLCLILFLFSMMSKPMMVTLPFVLLLLDYWPLQRLKITACARGEFLKTGLRLIVEKIPFLLTTVAVSIVTIWAQAREGAVASSDALPFLTRLSGTVVAYVTYLIKIFWPYQLTVFYPYQFSIPEWQIWMSAITLVLITFTVAYRIRKTPFLFAGWFWYLGTLVPVIGLVQVGKQAIADRYTYLPSIGISIMLAWSLPLLFKNRKFRKRILLPAAIILLIFLSILTWKQCGYWKSSMSLFNHASQVMRHFNPETKNIGSDFTQLGRYQSQQEIQNYDKLIRSKPDDYLTYFNRGIAFAKVGQYQNAIRDYNTALRLKPDYVEAYNNRGNIYGQHGEYKLAIDDFTKVIDLNPRHFKAYHNRGLAYSELKRYPEAVKDFDKAIDLKPDYVSAFHNRANVYLKQGNNISGCRDARKACELGNCGLMNSLQKKGLCR